MSRVAVVGGGLAGCASAVRLAKLGHQVTLLEARSRVGGAVGTVEQDGFRWDAGPAVTALPAVLRDLFRKSGRPLEKELELLPVQPMREHRFLDGTGVPLPSGSRGAQLAAVDTALGTGLGTAWVDYVHGFAETWDILRRDLLERPHDPALLSDRARTVLRTRRSLSRHSGHRLRDPRLRRMATHHAVAAGHDPRRVPAWWGMLDYVEQNFGTWTFPDGLGSLAGLLAKRLRERRVTVLTGTRAVDLEVGASGPVAVRTGAGRVPADVVVVAVDPRGLPALARHAGRTTPSAPPAVVHLGLAEAPPLLQPGRPGTDPGPAVPHELVLHEDSGMLVVRSEAAAQQDRAAWTLQVRGRLPDEPLRLLARRGLDVRDLVLTRVDRSPADLLDGPGSPYGFRWQGPATLRRRPGPVSPVPGVLLAGAATGGGGWLPFVGLTAAVVADLVGPA
jgi:phytoene dehydrogenase-like protein